MPSGIKDSLGFSMLRGSTKTWWDNKIIVEGEEKVMSIEWAKFKELFFKEFRSESEITRLRREFLNTNQGSMTINEFKIKILDRAQFFPEYLKSDTLLKEHFYSKLRKSIRERISLRQVESFSVLVDVARDHEKNNLNPKKKD
uniref:uncharacterized protein LOC122604379 n=1 Tax=Erigeron canadensis TaxID=72917 RepID=UPI001CB89B4A|nr:uncharacterized protein LOC122604379 [Erigeron canadensis]